MYGRKLRRTTYRRKRTYRTTRPYARRRTTRPGRSYSKLSYYKRNRRTTTGSRSSRYKGGPCPLPDRRADKKALWTLLKQNELYTVMFTDSEAQQAVREDQTVIGCFQILHAVDINACIANIPNAAGTYNNRQYALIMRNAIHRTTFTNFGLQAIDMTCWIIIAKKDIPDTTGDTQAYRPDKVWQIGVENINYGNVPSTASPNGYLHPFSQPSDSTLFRDFYYVVKRVKFQLLPGGTKDIAYIARNMPAKLTAASDANSGILGGSKGITMSVLWQARGVPCLNNGSITTTYYSRPSLGIIENKRYNYSYTADPQKNLSYTTDGLSSALANPTWINPLTATGQSALLPYIQTAIGNNTASTPLIVAGNGSTLKANAIPVQNQVTPLT